MIKKFLLTASLAMSLIFFAMPLTNAVFAVDVLNQPGGPCAAGSAAGNSSACQDNKSSCSSTSSCNPVFGPNGIITTVAKILSLVIGIIAIFVIIIAAIQFTTSGGDSSKVSEARNSLIYALVGLVVAAMAQVLVAFVLDKV